MQHLMIKEEKRLIFLLNENHFCVTLWPFCSTNPPASTPLGSGLDLKVKNPDAPPFYFDLCVVRGTKFNFVPTLSYFSLKFLSVSLQNWFQNRNIDQQVSNEKKSTDDAEMTSQDIFFVSSSKRFSIATIATTSKNSKTKLKKKRNCQPTSKPRYFEKSTQLRYREALSGHCDVIQPTTPYLSSSSFYVNFHYRHNTTMSVSNYEVK